MKPRKFSLAATLVALAVASFTRGASAQADPFADYEAMKNGQAPPPPTPPPVAASTVAPEPIPPPQPELSTAPWKWSIGGRGAFSYTGIGNATLSGEDMSNRTLFFRLTPTVGLTVYKSVLVSASLGLIGNNLPREGGHNATELAGLLELTAHYIQPVTRRLAFMPGLGLGPYFGSSHRRLTLSDGRTIDEPTSTFGFAMSAYVQVGYQISHSFELRTGLALYGLFQTEHIESANRSLSATAVHVGLPLEVHFHF
ncbi:hypothetical protein [Polyangium aurulentum]|uniref:hypothetical protein n=1 Tax=Polyangium aurulentum TaxID=2567896 RepID=UPI0010ADE8CB|nr:hypothetical protein [Polyangium aurulentum]UQA57956.1 hypothetical protein E8A73_042925 [Polyangium aurulentum]